MRTVVLQMGVTLDGFVHSAKGYGPARTRSPGRNSEAAATMEASPASTTATTSWRSRRPAYLARKIVAS